jgi:ABC-2 type transport system ATP-binding protein
MTEIIQVRNITHQYPPTRRQKEPVTAVSAVSFQVDESKMFCLLGPNGSGKSTLFRILSTMIRPTSGKVSIDGLDLDLDRQQIRHLIGVVFQRPSLDIKLTARENLLHQGHLYNLHGQVLAARISALLEDVGLLNSADELVEHLSGGNQRRVELAKSLLHTPKILILDEPSTGLDPVARKEFGLHLQRLSREKNVTVLLTTHLLDEAEMCDRIGIMEKGLLIASDTPGNLKQEIGGEVIVIQSRTPESLREAIAQKFGGDPVILDGRIRVERAQGHSFIPQLVEAFPGQIDAVTLSKPTLEDVYIHHTGHRFRDESE